jgi:hypothetical protein
MRALEEQLIEATPTIGRDAGGPGAITEPLGADVRPAWRDALAR